MFSPGLSTPLMQTEGQPQPNFPPAVEEFVQGNFWQEHYQTGGRRGVSCGQSNPGLLCGCEDGPIL